MTAKANRLIDESSPYLRQHAHNPVDWFPWGREALDRAQRENKPILLSIGYSACHWCHVMERESFENPSIAALMNRDFINIKVDREERPDLDAIYMNAVQMLTGSGGWPLTVFLTPRGEPFYGGTYFPPADRYGRPGFPRVLAAIAEAYRESPDEVRRASQQLLDGFQRLATFEPSDAGLRPETVARGAEALLGHVDREHGGVGGAPKFPNPSVTALFLRRYHATRRTEFLDAATLTLTRMAQGGIYDQLGGGFHRYSVDAVWLVPHFEKMLYDNAQLVPLYLDAFLLTGDPLYRRVARETLDYLAREMTHPEGGLFSTQDADSEGEEGKFYLWRDEELDVLLSPEEADLVRRHYGVSAEGNFAEPGHTERRSILYVARSVEELATDLGRPAAQVEETLAHACARLRAVRDRRVRPGLDDKILTSWNALAIRALVRAANVLGEPAHLLAAERAAAFIDRNLTRPDGRLLRTWKDGRGRHDAILDDYAYLAAARLDLYAATGEATHLAAARLLCDALVERFADPIAGGFFLTASDHEELVDRPKSAFDGALPSGNAVAVESLLRLSHLLELDAYRAAAERALRLFGQLMERQPFGTAALLGALDDAVVGPTDVVVAGERDEERTRALLAAAHSLYVPGLSVYHVDPRGLETAPALLQEKHPLDGRPAAYVCRGSTCSPPFAEPEELRARLGA